MEVSVLISISRNLIHVAGPRAFFWNSSDVFLQSPHTLSLNLTVNKISNVDLLLLIFIFLRAKLFYFVTDCSNVCAELSRVWVHGMKWDFPCFIASCRYHTWHIFYGSDECCTRSSKVTNKTRLKIFPLIFIVLFSLHFLDKVFLKNTSKWIW